MTSITGTALNFTSGGESLKTPQQRQTALRQAAQEVVGTTFLGEMLKVARSTPFKNKMFHGGRGEEIFQSQLDAELTRRAGSAMQNNLTEAMVKRLSGHAAKSHSNTIDGSLTNNNASATTDNEPLTTDK